MNEDKWLKFKRGGIYLERIYPILKGNYKFYNKYFRADFVENIYFGNEKFAEWYLEKERVFKLGNTLIKDFEQNNKCAKIFRKNWKKLYDKSKKETDKIIFNTDLKLLNAKGLKNLYIRWCDLANNFHSLTNISIDALDASFLPQLRKELSKIVKDKKIFEEKFRIFNTPAETTYIQKRDFEILQLVKNIKKQKSRKIDWRIWEDDIKKAAKKYWWTTLGWMPNNEYKEKDVKKDIKKHFKDKDFKSIFSHFKNFSKDIDKLKKDELQQIKASKKFKDLLAVFEEAAIYHDQKKEAQNRLIGASDRILTEAARRNKSLNYSDIVWLKQEEIIDFMDGNNKFKIISSKRKKYTLCYVTKNNFIVKEGGDAKKLKFKLVKEEANYNVKELKGMPASIGKVTAKAIVSDDPNYLNKNIKQNQILVCAQTTPDFVPAMKKASAIVTDEGGATCHAAIISRELNIPCIVGTKIATKVLKDGDLVEVDAERGVVIILKKAK